MQLQLFDILPKPDPGNAVESDLTFRMFISFLEQRLKGETTFKTKFYEYVLRQFYKHPESITPADISELTRNTHLLELLCTCLFPPLSSDTDPLWGLSVAGSDRIFYSMPAFYNLISPGTAHSMTATATEDEKALLHNRLNEAKYSLILERVYHTGTIVKEKMIYVCTDKLTGLPKFYNLDIDNRFVDVIPLANARVRKTMEVHHPSAQVKNFLSPEVSISLSDFRFEGFSVITATDVTRKHALDKMHDEILQYSLGNYQQSYRRMFYFLRAFAGKSYLEFGLIPLLKVNDRPLSCFESYPHSIAINLARESNISHENLSEWLNRQLQDRRHIFYREGEELKNDAFENAIAQAGFTSYAGVPLYHNNVLSGLLEIAVKTDDLPDHRLVSQLDAALPILGQFLYNHQQEFKSRIGKVIRKEFSSIQPAVQWKFNEVAWNHLKSGLEQTGIRDMEPIRFEHVHPLYGSVDIRDSSIERNRALFKDMQRYFVFATETLRRISSIEDDEIYGLLAEVEQLKAQTSMNFSGHDETAFINLVERVGHFLHMLPPVHPGSAASVNHYFDEMNTVTGSCYENRRALEKSVQLINNSINQSLDLMQVELQQAYPFYFEKFRTDGIEYDIYIGQSISPQQHYKQDYLHRLRRWQLGSMAAIAREVRLKASLMPVQLQTTQLIYVNANPIDISFRTDEKRFDVEGAYNIRYQIVKKRIDKVHIKATGERLTQPETIAIVYSQESDAEEYCAYIKTLQHEGLLKPGIEQFELEELQGVTGLMALRVNIA